MQERNMIKCKRDWIIGKDKIIEKENNRHKEAWVRNQIALGK